MDGGDPPRGKICSQRDRLLCCLRRGASALPCEASADIGPAPETGSIRTLKSEFIRHSLQEAFFDRFSVLPGHAEKTAHDFSSGKSENPLSKAA